mgnify:FL=1
MRKIITILSILLFSICIAEEYTTQEELNKIENETQECIDKNYQTDYAMMQCTIKGTNKYKEEIERTIKATKNFLSEDQYKQYLKTQKQWESFMNEYDKLLKQTYEKKCPPYLACLCASGKRHHRIKDRAEDLSGFIDILQLFKKDGVIDDELNIVPFDY